MISLVALGDLLPCLTEWTKPDVISAECVEQFPKKVTNDKAKLSKEQKKKADERRRSEKQYNFR